MDMIRISENKLKVMLTWEDMKTYDIDCDTIDYEDTRTRRALRSILEEANRKIGFDTVRDRVFIQVYPSRCGGCELFVTRLALFGVEEGMNSTQKYKATTRRGSTVAIYEFSSLSPLLSACGHLRCGGDSAVFCDEDKRGSYFLLLFGADEVMSRAEAVCGEYGGVRRQPSAYAYIKEHCICICAADAIETLGALC
jgi:negative regulator of genetic competence, sporulation and motility